MPELPEVETTRRGIAMEITGNRVTDLVVREPRLRWRVAAQVPAAATGLVISRVRRRAKYLIIDLEGDYHLLIHLGMSGSLRIAPAQTPPGRHDHVDIVLSDSRTLRFNDPRRFGSLHGIAGDPNNHSLLAGLGPEPFSEAFNGDRLYAASRNRRISVKAFIMDARVVVGVGNIYAAEALYRAGIHPARPARRISRRRYRDLAASITAVLAEAIEVGGTSLKDFTAADGQPGYFHRSLSVYGRADGECPHCRRRLHERVIGQRTTVFCPRCQT